MHYHVIVQFKTKPMGQNKTEIVKQIQTCCLNFK